MQAIGNIACILTGTTDREKAASIIHDFFKQEETRVSYQNALVAEEEGEIVGVALVYDGARARDLDLPLERAAAGMSGNLDYSIPTEPEVSEFYLDTVSISPLYQGKGYGRKLIEAACDRARKLGHSRISLLVDVDNAAARRLYERLEFRGNYTKWMAGEEYVHMVRLL